MNYNTLKNILIEWTDADGAMYELAKLLGVIDPSLSYIETKYIYWSNNELGNSLYAILDFLVEKQFLLKRDEPDIQFKWNLAYQQIE